MAYYEAAGWRAYYDHRWLAVVVLMVRLCQEQFHIPFPISLVAAYHVARASAAWAPVDNDPLKTEGHLLAFYRLARRYSGLRFEPARAARLELRYWAEHRRLVGQPDKTAFRDSLIDLHAHLFAISTEAARASAEFRVTASNTVDRITGHLSTDPESDWRSLEADLRRCYRSIVTESNAHSS